MARPTRLEYTAGSSHKFWQVVPSGNKLTVTYGRIGTGGQSKTTTFASPAAAEKQAEKLVAAKRKAGYTARGESTAAPASASRPGKPARPGQPPLVLHKGRGSGDLVGLWHDGKDLWWAEIFARDPGDELLRAGASLADAIAARGTSVERWRFASEADAVKAGKWAVKHLTRTRVTNDPGADFPAWTKRLRRERPCTPRLEVGPGPVTLTRDSAHPYIYPRPPAVSFLSKRTMIPAFALVGPLDARLGKHTGVYVNVCPQALLDPYFEHVWEVLVQDPAKKSPVDAYFTGPGGSFATVHLSLQIETIGGAAVWALIEHNGDKSTVGWYRTTHFKTRDAAEKAYHDKLAALRNFQRVDKLGPWYARILAEITKHHRVPNQKPATVKLRVAHAAMSQSVADNPFAPSDLALDAVRIGGVPHFCQEDWDFAPKNIQSKSPLMCIVSVGRGDGPQWTAVLNDGDAGTINIYAAPGDPFGAVSFSCC